MFPHCYIVTDKDRHAVQSENGSTQYRKKCGETCMKIPLQLNSKKTVLDAAPDELLVTVLRRYGLSSVKEGCMEGNCGACTVLIDGKPVPSCKIPVAIVRNSYIVTLEYFSTTEDYADILKGFEKADVNLCGHCDAGKIFTAWSIMTAKRLPDRKEILQDVEQLSPCCVDSDTLINGILYARSFRNSRLRTKKDAKK
jgi:carbon-monoxide dehydrogenase small subunit